jgi:hypothetical protein
MANGKKNEIKELLKPGSSKRKTNRDNRKQAKEKRKLIRKKKQDEWEKGLN